MKRIVVVLMVCAFFWGCKDDNNDLSIAEQLAMQAAVEAANSCSARQMIDSDDDGYLDGVIYYSFSSDGLLNQERADLDYDGDIDQGASYFYNADGSSLRDEYDYNNDGTVDEVARYYYLDDGRLDRVEYDIDNDGSADAVMHYEYNTLNSLLKDSYLVDADGKILTRKFFYYSTYGNYDQEKNEIDSDGDGAIDRILTYSYTYSGNSYTDETVYDDTDADGLYNSRTKHYYGSYGLIVRTEIDSDDDPAFDEYYYYLWELGCYTIPSNLIVINATPNSIFSYDSKRTSYKNKIRARFNVPIDKSSVAENAITVSRGVPGSMVVTDTTIDFVPEYYLENDTDYFVEMASSCVYDILGNKFYGTSWSFHTDPFYIDWLLPAYGSSGAHPTTDIYIHFTGPLDETLITQDTVTVEKYYTPRTAVTGTITHDTESITFTPDQPLQSNTTYRIEFPVEIRNTTGAIWRSDSYKSFRTGSWEFDVINFLPESSIYSVDVDTSVVITFNEEIDEASVTNASVVLDPEVAGTVSVDGAVLTFVPDDPLAYGTTYTATVKSGIKGVSRNVMGSDYISNTFRTIAEPTTKALSKAAGPAAVSPAVNPAERRMLGRLKGLDGRRPLVPPTILKSQKS